MKLRWVLFLSTVMALFIAITTTGAAASAKKSNQHAHAHAQLIRRCAKDYSEDEIEEIQSLGEDGYEPDDCPLLAHVLTGPELHNFCQPDDEDWDKFVAKPNLIYEIAASTPSNYPTEPHLELYDNGVLIAQNDHYFGNNAAMWWWNNGSERIVYIRVTELQGRHECGNNQYTLSLHVFAENPYPQPTSSPTPTPTLTTTPLPPDAPVPTATPIPGM